MGYEDFDGSRHRFQGRRVERAPESEEKLQEVRDYLEQGGCVQCIEVGDRKVDVPPEHADRIFKGEYFTQIEIIDAGRSGVYVNSGRYKPESMSVAEPHCTLHYFVNTNYGKKDKEASWLPHHQGN